MIRQVVVNTLCSKYMRGLLNVDEDEETGGSLGEGTAASSGGMKRK